MPDHTGLPASSPGARWLPSTSTRPARGSRPPATTRRLFRNWSVLSFNLTAKTAIVTGASRGIGLATVHTLIDQGARVVGRAKSSARAVTTNVRRVAVFPVRGRYVAGRRADAGRV